MSGKTKPAAEIALRRARVSYNLELTEEEMASLHRLITKGWMTASDETTVDRVRKKLEDLRGRR